MIVEELAPEGYIRRQVINGKETTYLLIAGKIRVDTAPDGTRYEYDSKGKVRIIYHPNGWIEEKVIKR